MKAGMFPVAAILDEIFRSFFGRPDLRKDSIDSVFLAVMRAEPALTFMHMQHLNALLSLDCSWQKVVSTEN
jgi:hypothetical protein